MPKRKAVLPFRMTERQYLHLEHEMIGLCRSCGHKQASCEPDAALYPCEACQRRDVYGVEALLEREEITILEKPKIVRHDE